MENSGRSRGNIRPRHDVSPMAPPLKKRFTKEVAPRAAEKAVVMSSPLSGSSTVTSSSERSERSHRDDIGDTAEETPHRGPSEAENFLYEPPPRLGP